MTGPKHVTEKQLVANRRNAQRSTGPHTPQGKAVSRYNALKHGILAKAVIPEPLEGYESREEFEELLRTLRQECAPATALEEMMVERIAIAYWRLARLYRAEGGAIAGRQDRRETDISRREAEAKAVAILLPSEDTEDVETLLRQAIKELTKALHDTARLRHLMGKQDVRWQSVSEDALHAAAERQLERLQGELQRRRERKVAVEEAKRSVPNIDTALKYARYETALQRQLERALNTLERLQRRRQAEGPSRTVDLNVNVNS